MPDFTKDTKWYSVNFSNENVLQGQQTQFLRFKNRTHTSDIDDPRKIYIMPIVELLGMDESLSDEELAEKYSNQIFFNGADIFDLNTIFKSPTNYTFPESEGLKVLWYGGPKNHTDPEDFGQYFPDTQAGLNIGINTTQWIGAPLSGPDGPFTAPGEKTNFRIDYKGDLDIIAKITFFITTSDPTEPDFWDTFPVIRTDMSTPKQGDVTKNGSEFNFFDGSNWVSFTDSTLEEPIYGIKHLHQEGYYLPTGPQDHWHDFQEVYLIGYKVNENKPNRDKYWVEKQLENKKIYDEKSSYMLMRTNPKLSGNIKFVIDNDSNMYLDTIEANDDLSNTKFKRNRVNAKGNYISDLKKYYSSLNSEVMFDVFEKDGQYLNSKTAYKDQYDFYYGYGASQLKSKFYDEHFRLFAPLWVKDKLPEFFVIFKGEGPYNPGTYDNFSKQEILEELFTSSKIIKTYDLRDQSNIGTYLSTITKDARFKRVPLNINYESNTLSTWNGIDYRKGVLGEKGEYLHDFFKTDRAIVDFEESVTNGFQRNGLICPNLFNFEFLFYDEDSNDYDINRYFGFYVNAIDLAKTEIFTEGFSKIAEQEPKPISEVDIAPYSRKEFNQTNPEGIVLPIEYNQGELIGEPLTRGNTTGIIPLDTHVQDKARFFFVQGKDNQLYRINAIKDYSLGNENASNQQAYTGIQIYDKSFDISNFTGLVSLKSQLDSELLNEGQAQLVINLQSLDTRDLIFEEGEILEFEYVDINQNLQKWKCNANSTGLQKGDAWNYPVYDYSNLIFENNFNPKGTPNEVAKSLVKCINTFENNVIFAYQNDNEVILKSNLDNAGGNGIIFRRKLVPNSVFDNTLIYSKIPNRDSILNEDDKSVDVSTNGEVLSFTMKEPSLRNNTYLLKLTNAGPGYAVVNITINGGFYKEKTLVLDVTKKSVIFSDDKFDIEFLSVETDINGDPVEDINSDYTLVDYTLNDEWEFSYSTQIIEQRFIGGTQRNRSRCKIITEDAENIEKLEWFQVQKNKYSRLQNWNVQGQDLVYIYNLENEILDEGNNIVGYDNLLSHSIIQLDDNQNEFYRSLDRKILSYDNYKPRVGMLSFLPIKDFDFDLIRSDYAYTPSAEIFNYFDKISLGPNDEKELDLGQYYEIESGSVELWGFNTNSDEWEKIQVSEIDVWSDTSTDVVFDPDNVKNFNTLLPSYYYESDKDLSDKLANTPTTNTKSYFYRVYKALENIQVYSKLKVVAIDPSVIGKYLYAQDEDLSNFSGFLGLSDFFSIEDENKLQELIEDEDIDRFFFGQLLSEYNRLRENFNKNYAVKSRVVPYINKWVNPGTDCRDNPYRLNNSYAFGLTGFSPDNEINEKNASLHTHEFYYLDEFPENFENEFLENSRSYFFENISDDNVIIEDSVTNWLSLFKDSSNDWFMKYFSVGYPTDKNKEGESIAKKLEERYTFMNFVPGVERSQCIFRGAKIEVVDINPDNQQEIQSSRKYNDYKFSSILRIKTLQTDSNNESRNIEFVANDQYKTIVMITTLFIDDYKIQNSGYGYSFLYSAEDSLRSSSQKNENMLYESNSGYAHWNDGVNDLIGGFETQKHYNAFLGSSVIDFSDIKLPGIFDINVFNSTFPKNLNTVSNTGTEFSPLNEIKSINGNVYNKRNFYNILGDNETIIDSGNVHIDSLERGEYSEFSQYIPNYPNDGDVYIVNNQPGLDQNIEILEDKIIIDQNANLTYSTSSRTNTSVTFPTRRKFGSPSFDLNNNDISLWYLSGGEEYLNKRISTISFAEIFNSVNSGEDIKFVSIHSDGSTSENNYQINFIEFDKIIKNNTLSVIEDIDKPDLFIEYGIIGFDIENNNTLESVYRHRGRFEPKTRKIIDFWVRENESMTNHFDRDFLLSNTRMLIENQFVGDISNLYYTKISDGSIVKLSNTSNYQSLYPLVDEISIDFKDFFTFNSNWDNDYYNFYQVRYGSISRSKYFTINDKLEGTIELQEQKSFFGSKLMKTPNIYEVDEFNSLEISFEVEEPIISTDITDFTEPIRIQDGGPSGIGINRNRFNDGKSRLIISINTDEILTRLMLENNAIKEFLKIKNSGKTRFASLTEEELIELCKEYLQKNILNLFKIDKISLFEKTDAVNRGQEIFRLDLSENEKRSLGYIKTQNVNLEKLSSSEYELIQILDTKKFITYSISISFIRI